MSILIHYYPKTEHCATMNWFEIKLRQLQLMPWNCCMYNDLMTEPWRNTVIVINAPTQRSMFNTCVSVQWRVEPLDEPKYGLDLNSVTLWITMRCCVKCHVEHRLLLISLRGLGIYRLSYSLQSMASRQAEKPWINYALLKVSKLTPVTPEEALKINRSFAGCSQ